MTDRIDEAIAATREVTMMEIPVTIASTGRQAIIHIPADCTDAELAELCGWMLTPTRPQRPTRTTLTLPAPVAEALVARASKTFRRPKDEAVALIAERLRESGELRETDQ